MSVFDGVSGKFGYPEGAFTRLSRRDESPDIDPGNPIVQQIFNNSQTVVPGRGMGGRTRADGVNIWNSGEFSCSRTGVGNYAYTMTTSFPSVVIDSITYYKFKVNATPSSKAGNGGDGVSPFLGYSGNTAVLTDSNSSNMFFYSEPQNAIYLGGQNNDNVWKHLLASFSTAATQIDPGEDLEAAQISVVMSRDGGVLWISGNGAGTPLPLRAIVLSDGTVKDFGASAHREVVAGTDTDVFVRNVTNGQLERYTPNFSTEALGSAVKSWNFDAIVQPAGSPGVFDGDGNLWLAARADNLYMIDPDVSGTFVTHSYPAAWTVQCPPVYDSSRNRLLLAGPSIAGGIWTYSGWSTAINNSGTWNEFIPTLDPYAMYYDPASDVLAVSDVGLSLARRYLGATGQLIDAVSVDDLSPANPQVDYDLQVSHHVFYKDNAMYVLGASGGSFYLVRIEYEGDPIAGFGGGAGAVSSVLHADYEITGANTFVIHLYRSISPPIYADGEHSYDVDGER